MSAIKIIFFAISLWASEQIDGLVELPSVEDNDILTTESIIRNTTNKLFSNLQLNKKTRWKQYSTVHNFLVTLTLRDYRNLKEIAKLTRVDKNKFNNVTYNFMTILDDLLNEDYFEVNALDPKDDVSKDIVSFLSDLKDLKEDHGVNRAYDGINIEVLKILDGEKKADFKGQPQVNSTEEITSFDDNDLLASNEYWNPETLKELRSRRVFKGKKTGIKHFPFMASVLIFQKFQCAGSIIHRDLIITATSCVQLAYNNRFYRENPAFLSVRIGSSFHYFGGEVIPVQEVYFHPRYDSKTLNNNICLLRLSRWIKFPHHSHYPKKIPFDTNSNSLPSNTEGITIVGWGSTTASNLLAEPLTARLKYSVLDFYGIKECQEVYSSNYVTIRHFCGGFISKGGGACNRDVGGPGIANDILMGVISFGSPVCGAPDAPTVFTKVGYYAEWIQEIVEQEIPHGWKRTTAYTRFDAHSELKAYIDSTRTTTFNVKPIIADLSLSTEDEFTGTKALRMIDKKVFKEFLKTIFNSKEAEQYEAVLTETISLSEQKALTEGLKMQIPIEVKSPQIDAPITKMADIDLRTDKVTESYTPVVNKVDKYDEVGMLDIDHRTEEVTESYKPMVKKEDKSNEYGMDIEPAVIDKKILEEINKESASIGWSSERFGTAIMESAEKSFENVQRYKPIGRENIMNVKDDDNVLTLLYVSDSEKKSKDFNLGNIDLTETLTAQKSIKGLGNKYDAKIVSGKENDKENKDKMLSIKNSKKGQKNIYEDETLNYKDYGKGKGPENKYATDIVNSERTEKGKGDENDFGDFGEDDVWDFLSKNDLYEILREAIEEELQENNATVHGNQSDSELNKK